jgi:hypothetical protein
MNYSENTTVSPSTTESNNQQIKVRRRVFTGNEKHDISLEDASRFTKRYRDSVPADAMKGGYFGRAIFEKILAQDGCVGIRSYFARCNNGNQTFVMVGVEKHGNDLWQGMLGEETMPCPPYCSAFNPLNSSHEERVTTLKRTARVFTGQENHHVTIAEASNYTRNYRAGKNLQDVKAVYLGRNIFEKILSQADCVGIRFYLAINDAGLATLVASGVRPNGNDIYDGVLGDDTMPCPPYCSATNPLNF